MYPITRPFPLSRSPDLWVEPQDPTPFRRNLVVTIPSKDEVYFSTDIESDGPIPGPYSMLSFASAAFHNGELVGTFEANLELLPGAKADPDTTKFWGENPEAYSATRVNPQDPVTAMTSYVAWVKSVGGKPVFVAYPAGFDFLFMYWYMIRFAGESPFSFSALDTKTLAMAALGCPYRQATKRNFPKHWFSKRPHTHVALDDAIEQGEIFCNIQKDITSRRRFFLIGV